MIIVDFLLFQMPGMFDWLSIGLIYQEFGKKKILIPFTEAVEWHSKKYPPIIGTKILPAEIIIPGLFKY
jgi:hypothetical protein